MKYVVDILENKKDGERSYSIIHVGFEFDTYQEASTFSSQFNGVGFANKHALAPIEVKDA